MNPHLRKIWQGKGPNNSKTIRLDWSNERHHEVIIEGAGDVDDVRDALYQLAHLVFNDPNLRA